MPTKSEILIDLTKVRDAQAYDNSNEIIQQDATSEFFKQIDASLKNIKGFVERLDKDNLFERIRYHDTITISGSRGSGKTTFILNMLKLLKENASPIGKKPPEGFRYSDIESLDILDPTLIEEKEHIFLNILARIKNKVDEKRSGKLEKRNGSCPESGSYQDWLDCLKKLAAALPLLDGVGSDDFLKSEQWHDPVNVLEKGLQVASASNGLEVRFHQFVDKSLKLLGKKAFILAIDDIDTKFPSGWPVLEVIRKYLTTPQLIVVLSGDMALYSKLVRKQQWNNFGGNLLTEERGNKRSYDNYSFLVDQLENQYLLKVLKPERRLNLAILQQVCTSRDVKVKVGETELVGLASYVDKMFCYSHWLTGNGADLKIYRSSFLQEPVRTVVQVLYGYKECQDSCDKRQQFIDTLTDTFLVAVQRYGFPASFAKQPDVRIMLNLLVQKLAAEGLLERGYRLKAEFDNAELNRLMWVLGAVMVEQLRRNPGLYFDFFIKVGLSREMALRLPFVDGETSITLKDYLQWVGVYDGENSMTIARMASGAMRFIAGNEDKTTHIGTVRIMNYNARESKTIDSVALRKKIGQHYRIYIPEGQESLLGYLTEKVKSTHYASKLPQLFNQMENPASAIVNGKKVWLSHKVYYCNSLEELESNISSWHSILVNIPAHRLVNRKGEARTIYSIHGLLAFMGEMLHSENIKKTLLTYSQLRDYPLPVWDGSSGGTEVLLDDSEVEEEGEGTADTDTDGLPDVIAGFEEWQKDFAAMTSTCPLPTHIWGKVFTRFYYALQKLDDDLKPQECYLGHIMHRSIILFLNAVLVEEALYRGFSDHISLKNPAASDSIFYNNLKGVLSSQDKAIDKCLPFFSSVAKFPLWCIFLPSEHKYSLVDYIQNHFLSKNVKQLCNYCGIDDYFDFYTLLNSVVLVNKYKNGKPQWEMRFFSQAVAKKENKIRTRLKGLSPEEATEVFIKEFLKPHFIYLPQKKTESGFKAITRRLKKEGFISQ